METETKAKTICVGIDLGTTNSVVAYYDGHNVHVCSNEFGTRTTPSCVAFTSNERLVGEAAVKQSSRNSKNTIYESKRFIGRSFSECELDRSNYPFEILDVGDGNVNFLVKYHDEDMIFCPEEIGGLILQKMSEIASNFTGYDVARAVITVPAYFNDAQRQATRDAGRIAGLEVLRIINEPTAAAIAYGIDKKTRDSTVLIFDLGGGTIDTSLLHVSKDGIFEVLAIGGNTRLGGADFDQRLMSLIASRYEETYGCKLTQPRIHKRLRGICEKLKCDLSAMQQVELEIDAFGPDGEDFNTTITRGQFNEICADLFDKCMILVRNTLTDANFDVENVDEVVLVGGSTRIPKIQEMLSQEFNGKELCKSINPDEAVAYGAAIQAGILNAMDTNQEVDCDVVLLDVCPLSLGVETTGGLMSVIISRNTKIPIKKSRLYSTTEDNQTSVDIAVYEGERSQCADNRLLGTFDLTGISEAPRGAPKIRVSFELDADGIFTVTANDESEVQLEDKNQQQHQRADTKTLTIQNNKGRLSNDEVERIVKDAEHLEAQDAIFRKTIKARTDYESLLFGLRRTFGENKVLHEHGDKDNIKMVLEIVNEEFQWLSETLKDNASQKLIDEYGRKQEWLEMDVARPIVDAVNLKIRNKNL